MEGETSKIKKLASVERLNLNMSDPMNANLSSIFIIIYNSKTEKRKKRSAGILMHRSTSLKVFTSSEHLE